MLHWVVYQLTMIVYLKTRCTVDLSLELTVLKVYLKILSRWPYGLKKIHLDTSRRLPDLSVADEGIPMRLSFIGASKDTSQWPLLRWP